MLDQLPTELIYALFEYFSAAEILHAFGDINNHFNQILTSYNNYRINLKSLHKCYCDWICRHIRPEQVISLTLSDDCDTPGQYQLFSTYFSIQQFVRLRSLTLIAIDSVSLNVIAGALLQLPQLRSLSIRQSSLCEGGSSFNIADFSEINAHLTLLEGLSHLEIDYASWYSPHFGFRCALNLQSLLLTIPKEMDLTDISSCQTLQTLCLVLEHHSVEMESLAICLKGLPSLKHLQIRWSDAPLEAFDAKQWQSMTASLVSLHFLLVFNGGLPELKRLISGFRTSFWLKEKRWFVAFHGQSLFTLTFPDLTEILTYAEYPIVSTVPNPTSQLSSAPNQCQRQGLFYKEFRWRYIRDNDSEPISWRKLSWIIDFSRLTHWTVNTSGRTILEAIPEFMPRLDSLAVSSDAIEDFFIDIDDLRLIQIRTLRLTITSLDFDFILQSLGFAFPSLEHLGIIALESLSQIDAILQTFPRISSLTLKIKEANEGEFGTDQVVEHVKQLTNQSVMHRKENLVSLSNSVELLHLWLDHQQTKNHHQRQL